jgi:FkbM family methyltransferase
MGAVITVLKRFAAHLPPGAQYELRRLFFRRQIRHGGFFTDEKEYVLLDRYLGAGDWALDIGANVGHYTMRMAELVGASGRVIAVEPVPETFALLAANARLFAHANVSLINVAASDRTASVAMEIPPSAEGLKNYYQAHLVPGTAGLSILSLQIDALALPRIKLVKIDAEGHEMFVLRGMRRLLERDHPVLIVETGSAETTEFLNSFHYFSQRLPGSSNLLCEYREPKQGE